MSHLRSKEQDSADEQLREFVQKDFFKLLPPVDDILSHLAARRPLSPEILANIVDFISSLSTQNDSVLSVLHAMKQNETDLKIEDTHTSSITQANHKRVSRFKSRRERNQLEASLTQDGKSATEQTSTKVQLHENPDTPFFTLPQMVLGISLSEVRTTNPKETELLPREIARLELYSDNVRGEDNSASRSALRIHRERVGLFDGIVGHTVEGATLQVVKQGGAIGEITTSYDDFFSDRPDKVVHYNAYGQIEPHPNHSDSH